MTFSHPQGSASWICVLMSFSVLLSSTLISVPFSHFFSSGTPCLHRLIFFTMYHTSFPLFCVVITFVPKIQCRYFLLAIFQLTNTFSAALILLWNPFIKFSIWGIYFFHFWNLNFIHTHTYIWASYVALVVKNLLANAGDIRDAGLIPELGRFPGGGHGNPLQYSSWRIPWTEEPDSLQSQTIGHDWHDSAQLIAVLCSLSWSCNYN